MKSSFILDLNNASNPGSVQRPQVDLDPSGSYPKAYSPLPSSKALFSFDSN